MAEADSTISVFRSAFVVHGSAPGKQHLKEYEELLEWKAQEIRRKREMQLSGDLGV
jgi:hypothetical protein